MIKLIIFDWDDVIVLGAKEGYFKCYHLALAGVGVRLDSKEERKRILEKWGKNHREELRELLKENPRLLEGACRIYEENLFGDAYLNGLKKARGISNILKKLSKNYKLCVATGANPNLLRERIIPKLKIPSVFSLIISSYDIEDVNKHKPHPFMIEKILKSQGFKPGETVFVGDAKGDVLMAKAVGVIPIVVLSGHLNKKEAKELGVKYIIEDITKIEGVLEELNRD